MINDLLESTAERRARRNKDIKMFFEYLTITRHISFMDAYEVIGYHFYLSAVEIRRILATMSKSVQNEHKHLKE